MGGAFRVAQIAGIDIRVHVSFGLIVAIGALQWGVPHGATGAVFGALLMLTLFACVTLHELGHSLAARAFGIPVREIVLLPIGGLAMLEHQPRRPLHELVIALAGPLVNLVLAIGLAVALALLGITSGTFTLSTLLTGDAAPGLSTLLQWLLLANLWLLLFNLLPAFPLDGGRALRALLAMALGDARATTIAARIGLLLAVALGVWAIMQLDLLLLVVALFIFFGARQELGAGRARSVLRGRKAGEVYNRHALTLAAGDRVSTVAGYILTSYQPDFAVLHADRLLGIVTRDDVLRSLAHNPHDGYVTAMMRRTFVAIQADTPLDQVHEQMGSQGIRVVAVYEGDTYLGLLSMADLAEAYGVLMLAERREKHATDARAR